VLAERGLTVHKLPDAHLPLISHSRHSGTVSRAATEAPEALDADCARPGSVPTAGWLPPPCCASCPRRISASLAQFNPHFLSTRRPPCPTPPTRP
jgi:hypothetical protein